MTVLRCLDAVLEPTKRAVLDTNAALDAAGVINKDAALRQAAGQAFYNTSKFTLHDLRAKASWQQRGRAARRDRVIVTGSRLPPVQPAHPRGPEPRQQQQPGEQGRASGGPTGSAGHHTGAHTWTSLRPRLRAEPRIERVRRGGFFLRWRADVTGQDVANFVDTELPVELLGNCWCLVARHVDFQFCIPVVHASRLDGEV